MSEDVTITLEAALVRLSALEVRSLLRMQQQTRRWGELQAANPWAYNIWETGSKVGALQAQAVLTRPPPGCALAGSTAPLIGPPMLWSAVLSCRLLSQGWACASPPTAGLHTQMTQSPGILVTDGNVLMFSGRAHASSAHQGRCLDVRVQPVAGAQSARCTSTAVQPAACAFLLCMLSSCSGLHSLIRMSL